MFRIWCKGFRTFRVLPRFRVSRKKRLNPNPKQLKRAQALTGALQWVTTRTRPDICFAVNRTAQLMSRFPRYATRYAENIIRYLRATPALGLVFRPLDDQNRFGKCEELTAPRSPPPLDHLQTSPRRESLRSSVVQ